MQLAKWWLIGILVILPFQLVIADIILPLSKVLSTFIQYLDEITVVVFFPIALVFLYKERLVIKPLKIILTAIALVGISAMASGIINRNPLFITTLGTFDYIKNFFVIFIYAAFFRKLEDFKRVFGVLLAVAVFLGSVAILQELWALSLRYVFGLDIYNKGIYIFRSLPLEEKIRILKDFWRMGIYRAPSLTHHPNSLGLFSLLILTVYLFTRKTINPLIFISFFSGIFVSASRMDLYGLYLYRRLASL